MSGRRPTPLVTREYKHDEDACVNALVMLLNIAPDAGKLGRKKNPAAGRSGRGSEDGSGGSADAQIIPS